MDHSPFGKLPTELRDLIYDYSIGEGRQYCILTHFNSRGLGQLKAASAGQPLAISSTCRLLHQEYTPLFYKSNSFMIRSRVGQSVQDSFSKFTSMIGKTNAEALRNVTLRVMEQRMDSFESVCSVQRDIESILQEVVLLHRVRYPHCQFQVQIDLIHCSQAPANATFLLQLDFEDLETSWQENLGSLKKRQTRAHFNGDYQPIVWILEHCRKEVRKFESDLIYGSSS